MRIGYLGLGWATRAFHVPALRRQAGVEAVGGFDSSAEQRASWERETGLASYDSFAELIEQGRPDLVVVATPPDSHAELCLRALEAGKHVFCEKPFVSTVAEADQVLLAAAEAGRFVAVNHEFREKPIFKALQERIGSSESGRLVFCQVWQLMDLAPWDEPVAWRAAMPNRSLFEGGVHLVDLVLTLFGEKPAGVYARHSSGLEPGRDADAIHLVVLEFSEGRLAQITIDRLCPAATRYVEVRADCERESLRASLGGRALLRIGMKRAQRTGIRLDVGAGGLAWAERGTKRKVLARNPRDAGAVGTARLLARVLQALREGREPPSSAREARDVLEVIEAAYRSATTGERIALS
ncbi:MAG: Gfo/Idh/MocA family oxidoreductase [Actinobacteria bacterium]|nr:Gfo/Idh/MocA family oxidoreductase [Actinomycetota bacterium]